MECIEMTHKCPYVAERPWFNEEGFVFVKDGEHAGEMLCMDFDAYCSICWSIYREDAIVAAEDRLHEPPEEP